MSGDKSFECIIYDVKIRLIYLIQVSVMLFTIETYFLIYLNLISFLNTKKKLYNYLPPYSFCDLSRRNLDSDLNIFTKNSFR